MLNGFIEVATQLSGTASSGFILDVSCGAGREGGRVRKMEGLDVGWEEEGRRPEVGGTAGTLREDGDDNRSVTSRRKPTPLSLAGGPQFPQQCSPAAAPQKLSSRQSLGN